MKGVLAMEGFKRPSMKRRRFGIVLFGGMKNQMVGGILKKHLWQ
jgi:hypothetical protein